MKTKTTAPNLWAVVFIQLAANFYRRFTPHLINWIAPNEFLMNSSNLNSQAEQLLEGRDFQGALSTFQQVFLAHGKSEEAAVLVEVARALRGAIYCLQQMGQAEKSERILSALEGRFGKADDDKVRYYVELARSGAAESPRDVAAVVETDEEAASDLNFDEIEAQLAQAHEAATASASSAYAFERTPKIIPEADVSLATIEQILENAFLDCEITADDLIRVQTDGPMVLISVNQSNHLLRFCAYYGMNEFAAMGDKFALANKINDGYILVRASIDDETTLSIDSYLIYKGGVLPVHIVMMLRLMGRVIPSALREIDAGDILS